MGLKLNRDGLPPEIAEEERWLIRIGEKHAPDGWNNPENWRTLDEIPEDREAIFNISGTFYLVIDGDHIAPGGKIYPEANDILSAIVKDIPTYAEWSQSGSGFHTVYDLSEYAEEFPKMTGSKGYYDLRLRCAENAHIEFYFKTGHLFRLTGNKVKNSTDRVTGGEQAAEAARRILRILETHNGTKAKESGTTNGQALPDLIPEGQRHYFIVQRCGELVNRLGKRASVDGILSMVETDFLTYCANVDNVDMEDFRKKYRKTIEAFQEALQREAEDPTFYPYALKAWKHENPGKRFDPDITPWSEVAECGRKAKEAGWEPKAAAAGRDREQSGAPHKLPRRMADVEKKEVSWLIPGYIPLNAITVIAGDGGAGKTTVETDIVASVSSGGRPFLLGFPVLTERDRKGPGGNVLLMSGEDYAAYTLRDKVEKADGDMEKVYVVDPSDADIKDYIIGGRVLEDAVREIRPKLVVIDPLQSFLDKEVNMIARNEIRQALMPLASLAENYGFACMIAAHSNKRDSASGRNRVSDSSDIWDIARSVLMIGFTQEEGVRYLSHEKSNWGSYADTVLFRIEGDGRPHFMRYTKQKDSDFQNEKRKTASDTKAAPKREEAEAFILEYLQHSEGGMSAWSSIAKAGKCEGISDATMKGARDSLKDAKRIKSIWRGKTGKGKGTECFWMLDSGHNINDLEIDENEGQS